MTHAFRMRHDLKWDRHAEIYGLHDYQRLPRGEPLSIESLVPGPQRRIRIRTDTRIVALGSCFAQEVSTWLRKHGYCLLDWDRPAGRVGTMYHTDTLRQEFERAAYNKQPSPECFRVPTEDGIELVDPYRAMLAWDSDDERLSEPEQYGAQLIDMLRQCDVLIFTAGQIDVWRGGKSRSFSTPPPPSAYDSARHKPYRLSYWDNRRNLEAAWQIAQSFQPAIRMLVSVSPVLLGWTTDDANAIVAAMDAKAQLRAAVGDFARLHSDRIEYFPAFEAALWCIKQTYRPDNRHVRHDAVDQIMSLFERLYTDNGA